MVSHVEATLRRVGAASRRPYITHELREHYLIEKELANRLRRASKTERRALYHIVYDERSRRIPQHPLVHRAADPAAQRRAVLPQAHLLKHFCTPQTNFLEIGVGDGALSLEMTKWLKQVYALDVSDGLTRFDAPPDNFEFYLFNGLELPLPPDSVDLAYSNDVLEHLHPDDAFDQLMSVLSVLRRGGKYICVTPNRLSGPHDVSRHFDDVATGFHLKEYTIGELAVLFRTVGFAQVKAFVSVNGTLVLPPLGVTPFIKMEGLVSRMSRPRQKKIARFLAAVKVLGIK